MRNSDFYELIAQVLPTLLVAVAIELRHVLAGKLREFLSDYARLKRQNRLLESNTLRGYNFWPALYFAVSVVFVLGETSSLAVVLLGTDGWLPLVAAPTSIIAAVTLILVAVTVPIGVFQVERMRISLEINDEHNRILRERSDG